MLSWTLMSNSEKDIRRYTKMSLNAREVKGGGVKADAPVLEPGGYPARLVAVVDLGVHPVEFEGEAKEPATQMWHIYEALDEFMLDEDDEPIPEKPRWFNEEMPLRHISSDRAKSTKRYKVLDPDMEKGGNWPDLLGTPCTLNLVQNPGKGKNAGRVFMKIDNTAPMRAKERDTAPDLVNEPFFFSTEDPDMEVWTKRLPDFIKDRIKSSLEFEGSELEAILNEGKEKVTAGDKEEWK